MAVKKTKTISKKRKTIEKKEIGIMSFGMAVKRFFQKYFYFSGTATRSEYWWNMLFVYGVEAFLLFSGIVLWYYLRLGVLGFGFWSVLAMVLLVALVVFVVAVEIPLWAISARRLHDAGFSAHLLWISLVLIVASIFVRERFADVLSVASLIWGMFLLVLKVLPSKFSGNKYRE